MNTNSTIEINNDDRHQWGDGTENPGNIVFWGGANGTDSNAIVNSPFFVTDKGNLYAASGYFTGTIITNSTITAAEIRTARIYGTGKDSPNDEEYGLIFYNATRGISFKDKKLNNELVTEWKTGGAEETELLSIGSEGFMTGEDPFIYIHRTIDENSFSRNNKVSFYGNLLKINTAQFYANTENLNIEVGEYIKFMESENEKGSIKLLINQDISYGFNLGYENTNLIIDSNSIELSNSEEDIENIYFGRSEGSTLKFNHVNNGFDIYVQ